jgi:spore coat polysaccharide biosynthesis protein SpsF
LKVGFLVTARLKSTRLPEKLLKEVCGRPMLTHMIDRLKHAKKVDQIIICTSTNTQDDRLADLAKAEKVQFFRGDENDVLRRLSDAASTFDIDYIVNMTADCPLIDPYYVDKTVEAFESTNADWIRGLGLPHGAFSYGIKPSALKKILEIKDNDNTEVWGRYFTDTDLFTIHDLAIDNVRHQCPHLRMALDYPEDLDFFEAVFEELYQPGEIFTLDSILDLLEDHPEIAAINASRKADFNRRITRQSRIELKPRYDVKRAAILGCGSIGQKHIRNLKTLGISDIVTLRSRKGHFKNIDLGFPIKEVAGWQELIDEKPDVALICNPTSLHLESINQLLPHIRGVFIEKPLSTSLEGIQSLIDKVKMWKVNTFIGYNLQFHEVVRQVQKCLNRNELGKPFVFQCQVGQWLPSWHPYENYMEAYYSRPDLGGGATLTLIHEIHLALHLLGRANSISALMPKSSLPIKVDTIADIMMQHASGAVSQIHLDFIQRPSHRSGVISCEQGWVGYDLIHPRVTAQFHNDSAPYVVWEDSHYDTNQPYVEELETFLNYVREGRVKHDFDIWEATQSLAVSDAAFKSVASGQFTQLPGWVRNLNKTSYKDPGHAKKIPAYK